MQRGIMGITRGYVGNMADQAPFSNDFKKKEAGVLPNCSNKRAYTPSRLENDMIDREYL